MAMNRKLQEKVRTVAAELRKEVFGPEGIPEWGTKFTEIEDTACELGEALSRELIQQAAAEQAQTAPPAAWICGGCGQSTREHPDEPIDPFPLDTSCGEVAWQQPKRYCDTCRQAFFPSVPSLGLEPQ